MHPFVLLDDAGATPQHPASRLYTGWLREHRCDDPRSLNDTCVAVDADLADGLHAVLLADYEWGARLLSAGDADLQTKDAGCLRVLVFEHLQAMSADDASRWLAEQDGARETPGVAGTIDLCAGVERTAFENAIAQIHEAIRRGETYQVNYTYRIDGSAFGSPIALYRRLRAHQRVGFGALIRLPAGKASPVQWVLSRSPELFVRHEAGIVQARPMKGTAVRARAPESDSETARLLHEDAKNRAENLMIVDLLRNDLGRVAELGSVRVPQLFEIEPYATVFQMTSTVHARLRADVGLADLLRATFPCGSITGAPKHHTMELIAGLETRPRGLYTGAIGWLQAPAAAAAAQACPDLCLSVAIRTLTLGAQTPQGLRPLVLGVGGGIVLDSVAADEWEEARWKARFLTALDPGLELFETMRVEPDGGIALLDRHRARMRASAAAFGFDFDVDAFDTAIAQALAVPAEDHQGPLRLRLALRAGGVLSHRCEPLMPLPPGPVMLRIEPQPLLRMPLSGHKTSYRAAYDTGIRAAEAAGAFDSLFFGEAGELIEGGRSSVLLRIDGRWYTPPVEDGALPGVMRAALLDDPAWALQVRRLTKADLVRASEIAVCNALRGVMAAKLLPLPALQSEPAGIGA